MGNKSASTERHKKKRKKRQALMVLPGLLFAAAAVVAHKKGGAQNTAIVWHLFFNVRSTRTLRNNCGGVGLVCVARRFACD